MFLREATVVSPLTLLLGAGSLEVQHEAGLALLDCWLALRVPAATAVLLKRLRQALEAVLARAVGGAGRGGGGSGGLLGRDALGVTRVLQQLLAAEAQQQEAAGASGGR